MKRIAVLLLLALVICPACASAVSFEVTSYDMRIEVGDDGAGLFTENLTYAFEGDYNGIDIVLRHEQLDGVQDISLFCDGDIELERVDTLSGVPYTYTVSTSGDETTLRVYTPGRGDTRTYRLRYRMGGIGLRYRDTARINYVALHSAANLPGAAVTLVLPGADAGQIQAFAHGAMGAGDITVTGGTVTFGPADLSSGDKVEIQVLFPEGWLSGARTIQSDILKEALAIEEEIALQAARAAEGDARRKALIGDVVTALLSVYALGFLALWFAKRRQFGLRRPVRPTVDNGLLQDTPAAIAQELREGHVTSAALCATLMELAGQGVLCVRPEGEEPLFTLQTKADARWPHQARLISWLFADGDTLRVSSLDAGEDTEAAQAFTDSYNKWKNTVSDDAKNAGLIYGNGGQRLALSVSALVLGLSASMTLFGVGRVAAGALALVLAILLCVCYALLRRLTDEGEKRVGALCGFIENYADILERAPETLAGRAPLAMALGYMKPLAEWMDRQPGPAAGAEFEDVYPVWMYAGWQHHMLQMERTLEEAQSHNAGLVQQGSEGGSSGGGFSGGSGGGSSHGAW